MYGLIVEQYKDGMIPAKGYEIIEDIEKNMGIAVKDNKTGNWKPGATPHKGDELESVIKGYINECLSDNQWMKIDPLFRIQIYSFMFQAGSQSGQQYRWLAGLAQTINPNLNRSKIYDDEIYRKDACNVVNNAINDGTINTYYEKYKQKLKEQYNGLTSTSIPADEWKAYKDIAWNHRPDVIEDMYKTGKSISDIMGVYFNKDTKTNSFSTIKNETDIKTSRDVLYGENKQTQSKQQQPVVITNQKPNQQQPVVITNQKPNVNNNPQTKSTNVKTSVEEDKEITDYINYYLKNKTCKEVAEDLETFKSSPAYKNLSDEEQKKLNQAITGLNTPGAAVLFGGIPCSKGKSKCDCVKDYMKEELVNKLKTDRDKVIAQACELTKKFPPQKPLTVCSPKVNTVTPTNTGNNTNTGTNTNTTINTGTSTKKNEPIVINTNTKTTTPTTTAGNSSDYKLDTPGKIQDFQTWMDNNHGKWAYSKKYNKNYSVDGKPNKGYGNMGPNTNKYWNTDSYRNDYLKEKGLIQ